MDFLDPHKRHSHTVRLFVGYALIAVTLIIGTGILALNVLGFDINRNTGAVIQNGLVFVDAHLDQADIYLNGKQRGQTTSRLVIPAGKYYMELKRPGYRTWQNNFVLEGSKILRYDYPFLFPSELVTKDIHTFETNPGMASQSLDKRWLIMQKSSSLTAIDMNDLNSKTNERVALNLPAGLLTATGDVHKLAAEWSSDNKNFILEHTHTGGTEYVLINREDVTKAKNLTTFFAKPNVVIRFRDKKPDQFYLHDIAAQTLATAEIKSNVTKPTITGVMQYKPYESDIVVYITEKGASVGKVNVRLLSGTDDYLVRELTKSDNYLLDLAQFNNTLYAVVGGSVDGMVYIYKDPINSAKNKPNTPPEAMAVLKQSNPRFVSFSSNARFIVSQSGGNFSVYDIETPKQLHFDSKLPLPLDYKAIWMDGHRLMAVESGKLKVFDFDGTNMQTLQTASLGYLPYFDRNYEAVYTIGPALSKAPLLALQRTELRLTEAQANKLNTN